jgi:hypothetical protein
MAPAAISLLCGLIGGLERMGWRFPPSAGALAAVHGPLMISGFLGTLITLERADALGRSGALLVPLTTGFGALGLILGVPAPIAGALFAAGSVGLVVLSCRAFVGDRLLGTLVMALGACAWLAGNGLWLFGLGVGRAIGWWVGFLVLTIAGERLELNRLLRLSPWRTGLFVAAVAIFGAGLFAGGLATAIGVKLVGVGLAALALWLAANDVARRTVRQAGLTRFTAVCILSGFVWLAIAGAIAVGFGPLIAGRSYDAFLHCVLLGFVFTMIFGHAPIIFPAVLGVAIPFRRAFYAHLALLQMSLVVRIGGDALGSMTLRSWGGLLNAAAIVLFFASTALAAVAGRRARPPGAVVVEPSIAGSRGAA